MWLIKPITPITGIDVFFLIPFVSQGTYPNISRTIYWNIENELSPTLSRESALAELRLMWPECR